MLLLKTFVALSLLFALPELSVNWVGTGAPDRALDTMQLVFNDPKGSFSQCVSSGLQFHLRFEARLCRRKAVWFDSCERTRIVVQALQYDPISETYTVLVDRLGDAEATRVNKMSSAEEATRLVSSVDDVSLHYLGLDSRPASLARYYVKARVLAACRGDYSATLERISYFLSLGLIRTSGFDSGWIDFSLGQ